MRRTPRVVPLVLAVVAGVAVAGGPAGAATAPAPSWWRPAPGLTWQWQLSGAIDTSVAADVYDVDGLDTPASTVAALHKAGRKVICYVNTGTYENWRADQARLPAAVLGRPLDGCAGKRWLDVRRWDVLQPIMRAARKPVFHVEYEVAVGTFCPTTRALGFASMRKRWDLDRWRQPC